jgi:hypothetical protein
VGYQPQLAQAPERGARNVLTPVFFRSCRGLIFLTAKPTVSPWATGLRASGLTRQTDFENTFNNETT